MRIAIVGCGYVADLYMATLKLHPKLKVVAAMDIVPANADRFSGYWRVPVFYESADLVKKSDFEMVLNLTNPRSHYEVTKCFLQHGKHVYSEKPLAWNFNAAKELVTLAEARGLLLASAPCNHLGEAAQAVQRALKDNVIGTTKLVYAEMDDGFVSLFPYRNWISESGAPWPYQDEFKVGCTLEHSGYYITWLLLCFGPIQRVVAFQTLLHPVRDLTNSSEGADFSVASLQFHSGIVARLTCSTLAPHDHSLRIVGDKGILYAADCWFYNTRVYYRRYMTIRRRHIVSPLRRKISTHALGPSVKRRGSAAMDFARGPAELAAALFERRQPYISADFSLHLTEAALAIQNSASMNHSYDMQSTFTPLEQLRAPQF